MLLLIALKIVLEEKHFIYLPLKRSGCERILLFFPVKEDRSIEKFASICIYLPLQGVVEKEKGRSLE